MESGGRRGGEGSSPATCATSCSPRRRAGAPRSASIPAFAPASRSRSSTPRARSSRRRRSFPTSRSGAGRKAWRRSPRSRFVIVCELVAIGNGTASRETDRLVAELMQAPSRTQAHQGRGVGSRRFRLFGFRLRLAGTARSRRDPARRRLDRAAVAGPARRTRQDRSEVDRRRAIPARPRRASSCRARSTRWSRIASTPSASTSTPPRRSCLARVSGVGEALAESIVAHREAHGRFRSRAALKAVPRLGPKAFELAAGFLRIRDGDAAARRLGRSSGGLSGGAAHPRNDRARYRRRHRRRPRARRAEARRFHRRAFRPADRSRTSCGNWKSPAAIRARLSRPRNSRTASRRSAISSPA